MPTPPENERPYRFFNSEFLKPLSELGRLRIGTAAEYRQADGKVGGRADATDNATVWTGKPDLHSVDNSHPLFRAFNDGKKPEFKHKVNMIFGTLIFAPHAYLLCMSTELTPYLRRRMKNDFGYDMFFRVLDVPAFLQNLCEADARLMTEGTVARVEYSDAQLKAREFPMRNEDFVKTLDYSWQRELRFRWPNENARDGFIVDAPTILPFIEFGEL
ncbi:MAG: hypothetical protein E6G94_06280 [Alphaproteobacteria bacterium]|nr:MAG: hypothetical protein E6G94_06280 [Alphaproteobacteria bacterium]